MFGLYNGYVGSTAVETPNGDYYVRFGDTYYKVDPCGGEGDQSLFRGAYLGKGFLLITTPIGLEFCALKYRSRRRGKRVIA